MGREGGSSSTGKVRDSLQVRSLRCGVNNKPFCAFETAPVRTYDAEVSPTDRLCTPLSEGAAGPPRPNTSACECPPVSGGAPPSKSPATAAEPCLSPACPVPAGRKSDCSSSPPAACKPCTTTPRNAPEPSERDPFHGPLDFCSEFDFWSWAAALPRLVLASKTSFARFLRVSMCISQRSDSAPISTLYPLPVPCLRALRASVPSAATACRSGSSEARKSLIARALHVVIMALNYLHADFRHVPVCSLRRHPNPSHERIFARVEKMLWVCSDKGLHPLSSGRRGPNLIARSRELSGLLSFYRAFDLRLP